MKPLGYAKKAIWGGALAVALGATAWTLRPHPIMVSIAKVTRGTVVSTVSGEGRTRVRDLYVVAVPVDGQLERVVVQPGDATSANDVVATMRPAASRPLDTRSRSEATAALAAAKAAVARAEAIEEEARVALDHATALLDTTRKLTGSGSLPPDQATHSGHEAEMRRRSLDAAIAAAAQARAELARAQAVLGAANEPGQITSIRSPASGRILRVLRESAGPVAAGMPVLELGDVGRLEVRADLLSADAANVREGSNATITGWGGTQSIAAHVRRIEPAAFTKVSALGLEEQRVHVVLDLDGAPPSGLGHDYRVDAAVVVAETKDAVRVPSTALFRSGDRWALFRVVGMRARKVIVDVGPSDGSWTIAKTGIAEGDEVITQPSDMIEDDTQVIAR